MLGLLFCALLSQGAAVVPPPKYPQTLGASLHAAVRAGELNEVQRLIAAGAPVDARDDLGSTPLLDAVFAGNLEIASFLVERAADVNARHAATASSPLQYAVMTVHLPLVRLLLDHGARVTGDTRDGQTLLHLAAARRSPEIVDALLLASAAIQALDANGNTPLDIAVLHNQIPIVENLLRHHADAKYVHPLDGRGALHEACIRGAAPLIPLLIAAGADPTLRDRFGQTPLDIALAYKNAAVVAELLRLGQKPAQHAAEQAMQSATLRGQTEIARLLLDNGFNAKDGPYLKDAALKGQSKMVELLLDHGASAAGALLDAALGGHAEAVALLLDRGAPVDDRDPESGATPLMIAASLGRNEVLQLLLRRGANRQLRDKAGHTALDRAETAENSETVKLLR